MKLPVRFDVDAYNLTRKELRDYHELGDSKELYHKRVKKRELSYSTSSEDGGNKRTMQIDVSKLPFGTKTIEIIYEQEDININFN